MMADSAPTPLTKLPDDIVATLDECSPEQLRHVARSGTFVAIESRPPAMLKRRKKSNPTSNPRRS